MTTEHLTSRPDTKLSRDLAPCPICRSKDVTLVETTGGLWPGMWWTRCYTCEYESGIFPEPTDCVENWNMRSSTNS